MDARGRGKGVAELRLCELYCPAGNFVFEQ